MSSTADDRAARVFEAFRQALGREPVMAAAGLGRALQHSLTSGLPLQDAVVALGLIDETTAYRLLATAAQLPFADLHDVQPSPLARHLVPPTILHRHEVLPLAVDDREVRYVTATPCNPEADRAVSMSTGRGAVAMLTCRTDLRAALASYTGGTPSPAETRSGQSKEGAAARGSVLIVDDEATTRTLVRMLLERDGYRVIEAFNGRHALDLVGTQDVDLVVMDLLMPELDGYGAIRALREQEQHAATPIVVVTTEEGPVVEKQVLDLGADDYILKPFEPIVLTSRIKAAFRRQRLGAS